VTSDRGVRADASTDSIPVVALTAQAMDGKRQRLLSAGLDGYLTKPTPVRELPDQIRAFRDRARPAE
jgi:two-component system, cell cycle response regulator DivK